MDKKKIIIISDSSPLISLAIINKLYILEKLFTKIYVSFAVYDEVTKSNKPFSDGLKTFLSGKTQSVRNRMAVEMLLSDIGAGEAETIVLALEQRPDIVLIDDLKARKFAKMKGLKIIGTMGLLLKAKQEGLIKEVKPLISEMIFNNIRINKSIIDITLQAAQEIYESKT